MQDATADHGSARASGLPRTKGFLGKAPKADAVLADRILKHAKERPNHRAVVCDGRTLTYSQLAERSQRCAARIQTSEFRTDQPRRIGLFASNHTDFVTIVAAAQFLGAAIVPLPTFLTQDACAKMLKDAGVGILFFDEQHSEVARAAASLAQSPDPIILVPMGPLSDDTASTALDAWLLTAPASLESVVIEPEWQADLIYSSGTTGTPKGIAQSFSGRSAQSVGLAKLLGADRPLGFVVTVGLYSNFGMVGLQLSLWWGSTFFVSAKFSASALVETLRTEDIEMAWFAPATLLRTVEEPGYASAVRGNVAVKLSAGSSLSPTLKQEVRDSWPGPFWDLYGQTETGTISLLPIDRVSPEKYGSVGAILPTAEAQIIDDAGNVLPTGAEGEIVARTNSLMLGYHQRDEANVDATWTDWKGQQFHRTGDIGRLDTDGYLWLCDRKKDMIISGGYNIYPSDIEAVLQSHPAVFEAAVIGCPSAKWGETPVAFVTLRRGTSAEAEELRCWANERVAKIQRIAALRILSELPNGTLGKILKRELRDRLGAELGTLP